MLVHMTGYCRSRIGRAPKFVNAHVLRYCLSVVAIVLLLTAFGRDAQAAWDYWLEYGGNKIAKCAGSANESYIKLSNPDGQWVYIDGVGTCTDTGSDYVLTIKFLRVSINSARSSDIVRNPINFDWIGVELYKQADGQQRIEWLYHEEKSIQGSLANAPDKKIFFGNLKFTVPKGATDRATRMTFYLTAQGIPFRFGLI